MPNSNCAADMTICPECVQYVRHCVGASTVDCPFCEASFAPEEVGDQSLSGSALPRKLKTGVMAVSFVGATALGACSDPDDDTSGFNVQENDTGYADADTGDNYDAPPAEPVYGAPPPDGGYTDADTGDDYDAPPATPQYGAPPPDGGFNQDEPDADAGTSDADQDTENEDVSEDTGD